MNHDVFSYHATSQIKVRSCHCCNKTVTDFEMEQYECLVCRHISCDACNTEFSLDECPEHIAEHLLEPEWGTFHVDITSVHVCNKCLEILDEAYIRAHPKTEWPLLIGDPNLTTGVLERLLKEM